MAEQAEGEEGESEDKEYDCGTVCMPVVLASYSTYFFLLSRAPVSYVPDCS